MIGCVSDHFFYSLAQIKKNAIVIVTHIRNIDKGEINCERAACKKSERHKLRVRAQSSGTSHRVSYSNSNVVRRSKKEKKEKKNKQRN